MSGTNMQELIFTFVVLMGIAVLLIAKEME